jgi:hypothetical protein
MGEAFFDVETFNRTIVNLKQLANAHQVLNDQALKTHNQAYFSSGSSVSDEIPDVASVSNSVEVGRAIVEFISTIPGVETKSMLEVVSRQEFIALSDRAVSARLRRKKGGEVGMSLTFAYQEWPKHKLEFERLDGEHNRIAVCINIGIDCVPIGGEIKVGTKTDGQFVHSDRLIEFDSSGIVLRDNAKIDTQIGEKLNIVQLIQQITTSDNLGNPIDAAGMIADVKQLKIEAAETA